MINIFLKRALIVFMVLGATVPMFAMNEQELDDPQPGTPMWMHLNWKVERLLKQRRTIVQDFDKAYAEAIAEVIKSKRMKNEDSRRIILKRLEKMREEFQAIRVAQAVGQDAGRAQEEQEENPEEETNDHRARVIGYTAATTLNIGLFLAARTKAKTDGCKNFNGLLLNTLGNIITSPFSVDARASLSKVRTEHPLTIALAIGLLFEAGFAIGDTIYSQCN
jgi:hypothetical protein